jgi:hypothetical protein
MEKGSRISGEKSSDERRSWNDDEGDEAVCNLHEARSYVFEFGDHVFLSSEKQKRARLNPVHHPDQGFRGNVGTRRIAARLAPGPPTRDVLPEIR